MPVSSEEHECTDGALPLNQLDHEDAAIKDSKDGAIKDDEETVAKYREEFVTKDSEEAVEAMFNASQKGVTNQMEEMLDPLTHSLPYPDGMLGEGKILLPKTHIYGRMSLGLIYGVAGICNIIYMLVYFSPTYSPIKINPSAIAVMPQSIGVSTLDILPERHIFLLTPIASAIRYSIWLGFLLPIYFHYRRAL